MPKADNFVENVFRLIATDKGIRADFRRADNESYEWRIWPFIRPFVEDLEKNWIERRTYALIASAIAKSGENHNGTVAFGKAFSMIEQGRGSLSENKFPPRFMRILSSDSADELLDISRPLLSYISASGIKLDYAKLLEEFLLFRFPSKRQNVKARWAQQYLPESKVIEE